MNCDTAFDLMTDANGSRSGALARHFTTCPRCQQMQETLAPALEFLTADQTWPEVPTESDDGPTPEAAGRQPIITLDSLKIAHQAASRLAAQSELPRAGCQRLAGQLTRYAAVFAAGLLLALAFVPDRETEKPIPAGQCTRQEAAGASSRRSADTIQALAQSCTVCHTAAPVPAHDKKTSLFRSERPNSWDWLASFLREEFGPIDDSRCVAGSVRANDLNAICQRTQTSLAVKGMIA